MEKKSSTGASRRLAAETKAEELAKSKETPNPKAAPDASLRRVPRKTVVTTDPEIGTEPVSFDPEGYKFILTPPVAPPHEVPAYEYLGELPDSYGTRRLWLVARDPYFLFAYWDFSGDQFTELTHQANDNNVFLQLYLENGERLQQIQLHPGTKSWYLHVNRPGASFYAELGFYRDGQFQVAARSATIAAPRDSVSWRTQAKFVTIPYHLTFRELRDLIAAHAKDDEELADTLHRLQDEGFKFPFEVTSRLPEGLDNNAVYDYLGEEVHRRIQVGSLDITEVLRRRLEELTSSGQWTSSVSSPFGSSFGAGKRDFYMHVNAELIIYGGTDPKAKVRIDGRSVQLREDGTFSFHFNLPDGKFHIPIEATSPDEVETRSAMLSFLRVSDYEGDVKATSQTPRPEPLGRVTQAA